MNKKALIATSKLVQDHEFIYPFYRLKEEGYEVHTFICEKKQTTGYFGTKILTVLIRKTQMRKNY